MRRWLVSAGTIIAVPLVLYGGLQVWYWTRFGSSALFTAAKPAITLPFAAADNATGIRALGEVEQTHPSGHPGIDFQWDHAVKITAVADGTITAVSDAMDVGTPVLYVTQKIGDYKSVYKEMSSVAPGIAAGSLVKKGDVLGLPHCTHFSDSGGHDQCQIHWEFSYASLVPSLTGHADRLCPLEFYDADALQRINAIWASVKARHADLPGFPDLCNGPYKRAQ